MYISSFLTLYEPKKSKYLNENPKNGLEVRGFRFFCPTSLSKIFKIGMFIKNLKKCQSANTHPYTFISFE